MGCHDIMFSEKNGHGRPPKEKLRMRSTGNCHCDKLRTGTDICPGAPWPVGYCSWSGLSTSSSRAVIALSQSQIILSGICLVSIAPGDTKLGRRLSRHKRLIQRFPSLLGALFRLVLPSGSQSQEMSWNARHRAGELLAAMDCRPCSQREGHC